MLDCQTVKFKGLRGVNELPMLSEHPGSLSEWVLSSLSRVGCCSQQPQGSYSQKSQDQHWFENMTCIQAASASVLASAQKLTHIIRESRPNPNPCTDSKLSKTRLKPRAARSERQYSVSAASESLHGEGHRGRCAGFCQLPDECRRLKPSRRNFRSQEASPACPRPPRQVLQISSTSSSS